MRKNGLNDSDKVFVTVALWIAAISLFATAITLPMLPDDVTIVYKTVNENAEFYSKYNNLLTVLGTVIPAVIILVVASLKKRNIVINNFPSIMIFCIMLSACLGGLTIYGISRQMQASGTVRGVDDNIAIALTAALILSLVFSILPSVFHSERFIARATSRGMYKTFLCITLDKYWTIGAYGFLIAAIACAFIPGALTFIPFATAVVAYALFMFCTAYVLMKHSAEARLYDMLEN